MMRLQQQHASQNIGVRYDNSIQIKEDHPAEELIELKKAFKEKLSNTSLTWLMMKTASCIRDPG
jgi:hypothetical protein